MKYIKTENSYVNVKILEVNKRISDDDKDFIKKELVYMAEQQINLFLYNPFLDWQEYSNYNELMKKLGEFSREINSSYESKQNSTTISESNAIYDHLMNLHILIKKKKKRQNAVCFYNLNLICFY